MIPRFAVKLAQAELYKQNTLPCPLCDRDIAHRDACPRLIARARIIVKERRALRESTTAAERAALREGTANADQQGQEEQGGGSDRAAQDERHS